jgi:hypothetical protein
MGFRGGDVREWTEGAPGHYERHRREDLVQQARSIVLERDGAALAVKRAIVRAEKEEEEDPWALDEPAPKPAPSVPLIAAPTPRNPPQLTAQATPYVVDEPPRLSTPLLSPSLDMPEVDNWGFDEDEPVGTSEDEPDVEVDAGTSQSEGAGTGTSASGSRSGDISHPTELLSAPHSDAEIVNAGQESEESDPWDDDPWAEPAEEGTGEEKHKGEQDRAPTPVSPSKSPAPTLSPTKLNAPPIPPVPKIVTPPAPAVAEIPPSPAVHGPAPRLARGLERFTQKSRGSPSPTPSKFSSPVISNASPTLSHVPSSAFGTAPSSAFPASATYASPTNPYSSPPKPHVPLPSNPYTSPIKALASLPAAASFVSPRPPTIAPPITPAMRRAQKQAKLASSSGASEGFGSPSSSVAGSPPKKERRGTLQQDERESVGPAMRLFGFGGSQSEHGGGSQVGLGSPEQRMAVPALAPAREEPTSETYLVSKKAQKVLGLAEDALREGRVLVLSE